MTILYEIHTIERFKSASDRVRIDECGKASKDNKAIIRGTKYLLLKNRKNLLTDRDEPARLRDSLFRSVSPGVRAQPWGCVR